LWEEIPLPGCEGCVITNLHFSTSRDGWAVASRPNVSPPQRVLLRTSDGGNTWTPQPIPESEYETFNRSQFVSPSEGWAPAELGYLNHEKAVWNEGNNPGEDNSLLGPVRFYQTRDGGNTWVLREGKITETTRFGKEEVVQGDQRRFLSAIYFASPSVGVMAGTLYEYELFVYLGAPQRRFRYRGGRVILSTQDGGATWHAFLFGGEWFAKGPPGLTANTCFDIFTPAAIEGIDFVGENYGWIAAPSCPPPTPGRVRYLFRTQDGGRSWEAIENRTWPDSFGLYIDFVTPAEGWSWTRPLTFTTDGGRTWRVHSFIGWGLRFLSKEKGWAVGFPEWTGIGDWSQHPQGIFHTDDGGRTWRPEYLQRPATGAMGYDVATQKLWTYGSSLLRRVGTVAEVSAKGGAATLWGLLKKK
jgi:photosystem II stability/assembly factor-like uncharacterized protein